MTEVKIGDRDRLRRGKGEDIFSPRPCNALAGYHHKMHESPAPLASAVPKWRDRLMNGAMAALLILVYVALVALQAFLDQ